MARKRADSFKIALDTLREELRTGAHTAGARLTANDIAERLSLSQTPVREALSRLAGEGLLLDRRGQGFFVQTLSERDLTALFRLQLELLLIACDSERAQISDLDLDRLIPSDREDSTPRKFVLASERLFRVFAAGSSPPLARHLSRLHDQLAPVRAGEPRVLDRLPEEFGQLSGVMLVGEATAIREELRAFFARRIDVASSLIRAQDAAESIESI
ncbi:GntR family transcriptional regulator [uncultured Phenylobacterium sp.]|uniref:GntR family transcriptional regulator n=1 Tax=uncultured Phenylobacterium sp. TaxID=349273 RepID=UPI0025D84A21|nr:GntR family transcriptional regulator [uncultured Phenylobacterium sp.]